MDRDCKNCKHYVVAEVKGTVIQSCEKWSCEFEKKGESNDKDIIKAADSLVKEVY